MTLEQDTTTIFNLLQQKFGEYTEAPVLNDELPPKNSDDEKEQK